jgi:hypothetical protein
MAEDFEVLSAVLDGEAVDIERLKSALEDPDGRRTLVAFVQLRQVRASEARALPSQDFYKRRHAEEISSGWSILKRRVSLPLAAAAILVAMLIGSLVNVDLIRQRGAKPTPPAPARVLRFEPGVDWH